MNQRYGISQIVDWRKTKVLIALSLCLAFLTMSLPAFAESSPERMERAKAHYARAQSLLASAIKEFDRGVKEARPDVVLNSNSWRQDIVAKANELNKVISPQARISESGIKLEGDNRVLKTLPPPGEK